MGYKRNKEKIIKVAAELIHDKGFSNTTVDEILAASGVTKSNFYYHFQSKEDLAIQILERKMREFSEGVLVILDPGRKGASPRDRLEAFFARITDYHRRNHCRLGCPFGNLAVEMSTLNERFRRRLSKFFDEFTEAVRACLDEGVAGGWFRKDLAVDKTAVVIVSAIEGAILLVKTQRSIRPLEQTRSLIMETLSPREREC